MDSERTSVVTSVSYIPEKVMSGNEMKMFNLMKANLIRIWYNRQPNYDFSSPSP